MGLERPSEVSLVNELFMKVAEEGDDKKNNNSILNVSKQQQQ